VGRPAVAGHASPPTINIHFSHFRRLTAAEIKSHSTRWLTMKMKNAGMLRFLGQGLTPLGASEAEVVDELIRIKCSLSTIGERRWTFRQR
jgi:hypothetical protein